MEIRLLGPVEVFSAAGEIVPLAGNKVRGLVAMLALEAGRAVPQQRLIDALWGEREADGANALQVVVSKLRRVLADAGEGTCVTTRSSGYQLDTDVDTVDALRFEKLIKDAAALRQDSTASVEMLGRALELWRGLALADVPESDITIALRSRLDEMRRGTVDDLVEARLALGQHQQLVPELESLVAEEPLRERRWGQLIRALYGSGRQADAMRAFQRAREVLIEQIGVEPGAELRRLEAAVLAQDESLLVAAVAPAPPSPIGGDYRRRGNVRYPAGPCLGRDAELDQLIDLVERHRLVTLTGPGGVGKTRLALELCMALRDATPDGMWWIDLAAARSAPDALLAIQRSLGIEGGGVSDAAAALALIVTILTERTAVLVLDNCEQLVGETAPAIDELLARCEHVRVIATSREGFDLSSERVFPVAPLSAAAAAELFTTRMSGSVEDEPGSSGLVREICEQLDRLPLALELAAARTRHLGLHELRDRLSNRFEALPEGTRSAHAHQRNLRGVAEWSYELLDESERVVFERFSIFADGATVEAARSVCASPTVPVADVERLLHRLVDKSLVIADRSDARRFRMLQTLSDYASERLDVRGDRESARRAHALWVCELAHTVDFGSKTVGRTVAAVHSEDAAIRDAIAWSLVAEPVVALEICTALSPFWFGTMRVSVGWELLFSAIAAAGDTDPALRSSALAWGTVFATMVQDIETADRLAQEALTFERALGDPARLGRVCLALALAAGYRADADATGWAERARAHFFDAGQPAGAGQASFAEGAVHVMTGELGAAARELGEAIAVFRQHDDHLGLILAVSRLGEVAWRQGDMPLFAEMHAELLELGRTGGSAGVVTGATARLALAHLAMDDVEEAQSLARIALASSGESFMPVVNGYAFRTAGLVNLRLGHIAEGREHLHAAIEAFEQGAGTVGVGQAALCWVDLSNSFLADDDFARARQAAETATEIAVGAGDPWVRDQAEASLTLVNRVSVASA